MRRLLGLSAALASLIMLAGCGDAGGPNDKAPEAVGALPQPIEGGYIDEADTYVVGIVHFAQGNFGACSGTLIAPNVVLTAGHCVAPSSGGGSVNCETTIFYAPYAPSELFVTTSTSFTQNPLDYTVSAEVWVPPDLPDSTPGSFCGRDQAILILSEPIDAALATPIVPRVDEVLGKDEEYAAIGYGETYDGGGTSGTRHRRDGLFSKCIGKDCASFMIYETEWLGDTGICSGDSGGPALDMQNRVVGVTSRGAPGCETPIYGHVQGWAQWIKDTTVHASQLAGVEPPPWATGYPTDPEYSYPVGGPCATPAECPSNACYNGYCTRACLPEAPCPDGFQCNPTGICEQIPPPAEVPKADDEGQTVGGCAMRSDDPTKPIPWRLTIGLGVLALSLLRRRSR